MKQFLHFFTGAFFLGVAGASLGGAEFRVMVNGQEQTVTAVDVSKVDRVPGVNPKTQKAPVYPAKLKAEGVKGEATISFVVSPAGDVVSTSVMRATQPEFGEAAMAAVREWKFKPGIKDGKPVYTHMAVPIVFGKK